MKHLRNMLATFPHLDGRSAIMGLCDSNIPAEELRRRQEEALERKRRNRTSVRITFMVRPGLPPCHTAVIDVGASTRIGELCADAFDVLVQEALRRGDAFGPLPSTDPHDYCLCRYNSMLKTVGPECPSGALVVKILATPPVSEAQAPSGGGFVASMVDTGHLVWVLHPSFLRIEKLVVVESKTRSGAFAIFLESLEAMLLFERSRRAAALELEARRRDLEDARVRMLAREESARGRIEADEGRLFGVAKAAFEARYAELETTMLSLLRKMDALRQQHRAAIRDAALRRTV